MTPEELEERVTYWQNILRLRDWKIAVKYADSSDEVDNNAGQCLAHQHTKTAVIKLIKPEAFNPTSPFSQAFPENLDEETTLVHEMLHIHFDGLFIEDDHEVREEREEQAIEFVAEALVRLNRGAL